MVETLKTARLLIQGDKDNCVSLLPQLHVQLGRVLEFEDRMRVTMQGSVMLAIAIKRARVSHAGAAKIWSIERRALSHIKSCLWWSERLWPYEVQYPAYKLRIAWIILGSVCERQGNRREGRQFVKLATQDYYWERPCDTFVMHSGSVSQQNHEQQRVDCRALIDEIKHRTSTDPIGVLQPLFLANIYEKQADYVKAGRIYKDILAIVEDLQGPNSTESLECVECLVRLYEDSGQLDKSLKLFERLLLARQALCGVDSPISTIALSNCVKAYERKGNYSRAEMLVRYRMRTDRARLGSEHPTTIRSLGHLAVLADNQGHFDESERLFMQTISSYQRTLGLDHFETANARENLALSYRLQGRYNEAEKLLSAILKIRRSDLGDQSALSLTVERLAAVMEDQGKAGDAQALRDEFPDHFAGK